MQNNEPFQMNIYFWIRTIEQLNIAGGKRGDNCNDYLKFNLKLFISYYLIIFPICIIICKVPCN